MISAWNQCLIRILSVLTAMLVVRYLDDGLPAFLNRKTDLLSRGRAHVPPSPILIARVGWVRIPSKLRSDDSQWILNQTLPNDWIVRICTIVSIRAWIDWYNSLGFDKRQWFCLRLPLLPRILYWRLLRDISVSSPKVAPFVVIS